MSSSSVRASVCSLVRALFLCIVVVGVIAQHSHAVALPRVTDGLLVQYDFSQTEGDTILDTSGVAPSIDLTIANPSNVSWTACNALSVNDETLISSTSTSSKIYDAIQISQALTVEAWIKPANLSQSGPARIVTLSSSSSARNFTLGQQQDEYVMRLRTTSTDGNGSNVAVQSTNAAMSLLQPNHLVYTREADGTANLYLDGVLIQNEQIGGDLSNWDSNMSFALANELTGYRAWLGEYYHVAVYDRALTSNEILQNHDAGVWGGL